MDFLSSRDSLMEEIKRYIRQHSGFEPDTLEISASGEARLRAWTRDMWGGSLGDRLRAGERPVELVRMKTVWDAPVDRVRNTSVTEAIQAAHRLESGGGSNMEVTYCRDARMVAAMLLQVFDA